MKLLYSYKENDTYYLGEESGGIFATCLPNYWPDNGWDVLSNERKLICKVCKKYYYVIERNNGAKFLLISKWKWIKCLPQNYRYTKGLEREMKEVVCGLKVIKFLDSTEKELVIISGKSIFIRDGLNAVIQYDESVPLDVLIGLFLCTTGLPTSMGGLVI